MNLVNVALEKYGAKIKTYSSSLDDIHQPNNILHQTKDTLWSTGQGLPQFVIVSLEELSLTFKRIIEVGFMLWHDYQTNPKSIQLWVAQTTDQQFIFWSQFILDQKRGIQIYQIKPLPSKYIYLKISITQTYGAFQTYLNQVYFMAQGVVLNKNESKKYLSQKEILPKKKQLNLEDLEGNLNKLIQIQRKISRSKSKSKKKQKILNRASRNNQLSISNQNREKHKKVVNNQISKGSSSSNKAGFSIYYRQQQNLGFQDSESRQYVSNEYQSSSSNNNKNFSNEKNHKIKLLSQQSEQYSQSINNMTGIIAQNLNSRGQLSEGTNQYDRSLQFQMNQSKRGKSKGSNDNNKLKTKNLQKSQKRNPIKQKQQEGFNFQYDQQQIEQQQNEQFSNDLMKNTPKYKQHSAEDSQQNSDSQYEHDSQQNTQYNHNLAILALSKHVVKIQDNMQDIQRKIQVLDLKVSHSHQKIEQNIFKKVSNKIQELVDRKIQKVCSANHILRKINKNVISSNSNTRKQASNKKQYQLIQQNNKQKQYYKKNLTNQFFKNQYYADGDLQKGASKDKTKTKRRSVNAENRINKNNQHVNQYEKNKTMNRLKASKSFADIKNLQKQQLLKKDPYNSNENTYQINKKPEPNQQYIAQLLQRLNNKLKQRQVKLYKINKKQQQRIQKSKSKDKKEDLMRKQFLNRNSDKKQDKKINQEKENHSEGNLEYYKNQLKHYRKFKNSDHYRKTTAGEDYYGNC